MTKLSQKIAWRYLFAKKSTHAINLITGISVLGITIGTTALILVLSVFNGFESVISHMIGQLNPDIIITPSQGKIMTPDDQMLDKIKNQEAVEQLSMTLEEIALFDYEGNQAFGYIKGVDSLFTDVTEIDSTVLMGSSRIYMSGLEEAINLGLFGLGIANKLDINVSDRLNAISVHMPKKKRSKFETKTFVTRYVYPSGIYSIQQDQDYDNVIVPISLVQELLKYKENQVSAIEVKVSSKAQIATVKRMIQKDLGDDYRVRDRFEQDLAFLKIIKVEKTVSFVIFALILLLVAFNLVGALWMIVLEKKLDISILRSMGVTQSFVKSIFIREGLLITGLGVMSGMVLAIVIYWIHQRYGIVPVQENFIVDRYPIELRLPDFLITILIVMLIGYLASILPARRAQQVEAYLRAD